MRVTTRSQVNTKQNKQELTIQNAAQPHNTCEKQEISKKQFCSDWHDQISKYEIIAAQTQDETLSALQDWKTRNKRPIWSEVSNLSQEMKTYWAQWDRIILEDGMLYRMFWCKDSRCAKRFSSTTQRERHWRDVHGPVRNCEVCGKSFPTNRTYLLKHHLQKYHPDGGRSSILVPPCQEVTTKSWKDMEVIRRLPYPFPNAQKTQPGSHTIRPQERPYIAQTACDSTAEPAIFQYAENGTTPSESAAVPPEHPEEISSPGSPAHIEIQELEEITSQTAEQQKLFPFPPRRPGRMMPIERWTRPIPLESMEPPVGRLYENLHSDPRVFFAGAPSSYHTGPAADLLRPLRDRALVCPNREVRHVPEGVAMIRRTERAYLPTGEVYELNTSFLLDPTYRIRLESGTMTDAAPSRQTVDTAAQCDIIQFRL
ncbi:hypothetical protein ACJMK2_000883 [Sinanodonta woodiana]|uniref:C2H2-type domain-containing protein n=1 Tax=Sinanodonta woodiana TaxID=1069815 RepID=A0ABD3XTU6_SINWO